MSNKKKALRNENQEKLDIRMGKKDHHHFCYPRKSWNSENRLALRRMHYCICVLEKPLHNRIHIKVGVVSIPTDEIAGEVASKLKNLLNNGLASCADPPEERLRLLASLFAEKAPWTANALYEQARIIDEWNRRLS